ncbi:Histone acetyltransferase ESA1 [Gigaspora margarita]|uniref:Histone acetyltransferase ESA1 n=1 Tax=Gigaspora margarita TaxID=4874 RepID=A0A8H4ETL8_GIGMA|nr:Histone acetyltransferase ESA1 [Gigaspora margarita]
MTNDICPDSGSSTSTPTDNELQEHEITINNKYYVKTKYHRKNESPMQIAEVLATRLNKDGNLEYYVHFKDFNKRLDEWVLEDRIDTSKEVVEMKLSESSPCTTPRDLTEFDNSFFSTSSLDESESLTQAECSSQSLGVLEKKPIKSRVKNLDAIWFGEHYLQTWYFSPYPQEYTEARVIYICEFCLNHFISEKQFERHCKKCTIRHPPGNEIYRDGEISFFEIDGVRQTTYCQNLSLLSKLFLDHKSLYYDLIPFMFYIMCRSDAYGFHIIGYFSKEKNSVEHNLACILTLPHFQRQGYGRLLIEMSYELAKIENKIGTPEKPFSDLGLLSYQKYWQEIIIEVLHRYHQFHGGEITIEEISEKTYIAQRDVLYTLHTLGIGSYQGQTAIRLTDAMIVMSKNKKRRIDRSKLDWTPPVFTYNQLRYTK